MPLRLVSPNVVAVVLVRILNKEMNMSVCIGCGRHHDSWLAYCTNCIQTQKLTKAMEDSDKRQLVATHTSSISGTTYGKPIKWASVFLFIWCWYMTAGFFFKVHDINGWDFLVGFLLLAWSGNE